MLRPPCYTRLLAARWTTPLSRSVVGRLSSRSAPTTPLCLRPRGFVRPFAHFNVAAVRLLRLTLLDTPILATAADNAAAGSDQHENGALVASSQQSTHSAQFIPPAAMHDIRAWERWLDSIDGEHTFIISRTLLPQLFERLNHEQQLDIAQLTATNSSSTPQLTPPAVDSAEQASTGLATSPAAGNSALAMLHQRLNDVQSVPLTTLVAPQRKRTKQQRASTAVPPAPAIQAPLTQQQKAIFDAIPSSDLSAIATLYSPSVMPVDQPHPSHGGTMLHIAAMHNRADVVHWLLTQHQANANSRAFNHSTPLHWAAGNNALASLRALLTHGADPTLTSMTHHSTTVGKGSGQTALHWAAESGHVDSVRLLSEWAPQLVAAEDERGRAARELAEAEGRSEVARLVRQLEAEEYVGVKVALAYRGQRIIGAQQRRAVDDHPR